MPLTLLVLALATAGYFFYPSSGPEQAGPRPGGPGRPGAGGDARRGGPPPAVPVATALAVRGDIPVHLDGLGTVTSLNTVTVRSRVEGELLSVHFTEGQPVKKGDLLAEIDPRPFEAQLTQAEGQLARDEALLENAKADLQRYQVLLQQDSIATQQVAGQTALVRQYEAAVKVDKGQIAAIKLQLTYCRITSPISGRAGLRLVDPGNVVRANDQNALVVISQTQPISAVFTLPEDKLPRVMAQLRSSKTVTTEAYDRSGSARLAQGTLLAVDNQIDTATGTVKLKAIFPNDEGVLFANQFVNVRMNLDPLRDATVIPAAAVQRGSQGDFAYLVGADGKVKLQTLTLGPRDGERIAVLDGLKPGAQVVVEGTDRLRDGLAVQVITPESAKPTAAKALVSADEAPAGEAGPPGEKRRRRAQ
ncbi:MdtA/MuxA family multidrug efflux RND transporter periplasmic adaptor subunit [Methylococcus sp. EFPC2]|uniref:MdtA/MuxA family multidrug efflux RND transporter periplasmic adaptor subunit n=1 Tax=Methylococcus sp. EFPC2 TaxID=2812648 RepID=UPI001F07452E|nr:MdtA/MuxA family multidrug efflux RND transporter periplasmic adaptor subunit [Methylococcus sp. EFPC2]